MIYGRDIKKLEIGPEFLSSRLLEVPLERTQVINFSKLITTSTVSTVLLTANLAFAASVQDAKLGQTFHDCNNCPEMVMIPAGSFMMGSNKGTLYSELDETPEHRVVLSYSFAMGKTEATRGQWKAIMGTNPSVDERESDRPHVIKCGDNCPVQNVSWNDAQKFIRKLNAKTGKQYRLPNEAEWEYACRAGGRQEYCGGDNSDSVAWTAENSSDPSTITGKRQHQAATKQANVFGLYDMSGSVEEWVEDSYHFNSDVRHGYVGTPVDGSAWVVGGFDRVVRGGSYYYSAIRSVVRSHADPSEKSMFIGFRLARSLP